MRLHLAREVVIKHEQNNDNDKPGMEKLEGRGGNGGTVQLWSPNIIIRLLYTVDFRRDSLHYYLISNLRSSFLASSRLSRPEKEKNYFKPILMFKSNLAILAI